MKQIQYHLANRGKESDTMVFAPYPFAGNDGNTGARYDELANRSGYDLLAAHTPGTGSLNVVRGIVQPLPKQQEELAAWALRQAEVLRQNDEFIARPNRVGLGDSGRAMGVMLMAIMAHKGGILGADGGPLFTHVLTRDGVNFRAPEPARHGARRLLQQAAIYDEGRSDRVTVEQRQSRLSQVYTLGCAVTEMLSYRRAMCKSLTPIAASVALAECPSIPFHQVGLGRGISGTPTQMEVFHKALNHARDEAWQKAEAGELIAPVLTTFEPTWGHGDLMDPQAAANHLQQTLALEVSLKN